MKKLPMISSEDARVGPLMGKIGQSWSSYEKSFVPAATLYLPFGCPDWGTKGGVRQPKLCVFCALPEAAQDYRNAFYEGQKVPSDDLVELFSASLRLVNQPKLVKIFNAGSFLAMPEEVQKSIMLAVSQLPSITQVVVEARARLIDERLVKELADILRPSGKHLQILVGIESQDDHFRNKVLGKGHTRDQLFQACEVMRRNQVLSGGYVLLKPAPNISIEWAKEEAQKTIDWVLGKHNGGLQMDEVQFAPTCVAPKTGLYKLWQEGVYSPPSLKAVVDVLIYAAQRFERQVMLGRFEDEPPFVAVPSNHTASGIAQDLQGSQGCDLAYHAALQRYRETLDVNVLLDLPVCSCNPVW